MLKPLALGLGPAHKSYTRHGQTMAGLIPDGHAVGTGRGPHYVTMRWDVETVGKRTHDLAVVTSIRPARMTDLGQMLLIRWPERIEFSHISSGERAPRDTRGGVNTEVIQCRPPSKPATPTYCGHCGRQAPCPCDAWGRDNAR